MDRLYLAKHRDTFHFRGTLKRLGLKFDGERRLWYAETQEQLDAALKLLRQQEQPQQPHGGQQGQQGATPEQAKLEPAPASQEDGGSGAGSAQGKKQEGKAQAGAQAQQSEPSPSDGEEGEGEGEGGEGPAPFATFAQQLAATMNAGSAAIAADAVLGKSLQALAKQSGKAEAEKQAKQMQEKVDKAVAEVKAMANSLEPKQVQIQIGEAPKITLDSAQPDWVADLAAQLSIGRNVRLVGPAGCGKTHGAQLAAETLLKRRFGFVNFSDGVDESHLYGFRDIVGNETRYVVPELCYANLFEEGGIWLGDEYDRGNPNVIVSLNGSLANGRLSLPKRTGKTIAVKHPEFAAVVTMNTWGTGPSAQYTSANRLDESSLDRFRMGTIYVDYNRKLEASLLPDTDLLKRIWKLRDRVMALGLQRVISTRFVADAAEVTSRLGWTHERVMGQAVMGWSEHDKQKVGEM